MQEVFSETQRYGRVARFELRPNRYGQAVTAAAGLGEERNSPRRAPDLPLVREMMKVVKNKIIT